MKQENLKNKLTKVSKESKGISTKNNLLTRSKKETKGITLIALVITIIVLLILAGVTIATLLGDNGIITRATTAKNKTQEESLKEQVKLDILEEQMKKDGGNLSAEELREILDKYFEGVPDASELEENLKGEEGFKLKSRKEYGGQEVDIGDIYSGDLEKGPMTAEQVDELLKNKDKVQYVTNYEIDIDGDDDAKDDWEVFYVEDYKGEEGATGENQPEIGKRIFLIASDYVKADTEALKEAVVEGKACMQSGTDGETDEKRKADYVKYWSSAPEYHCTLPNNEEGKACTFPKLFEFSGYNINEHKTKNNSRCAASLLCTGNWSSFKDNTYAEYATGGPTVEMWINSWNKRHEENKVYYSGNGDNGYYVGLTNDPDSADLVSVGSDSDKLYFPHNSETDDFDGDGAKEYCVGYWLASSSAQGDTYLIRVNYNGIVDRNQFNHAHYGVRPVVCLKSGVKLVKSDENLEGNAEYYKLAN